MNVRDTSHAAFRSLDLQGQERELMRLVHLHYPFPASFTRKELSAKTGWEINRIAGRVNSLVEKGFLKEYQQTRDGGHLLSIAPPSGTKAAGGQAPSPGKPGDASTTSSCAAPAPAASAARKDRPAGCYWPKCGCHGGGRPCELKKALDPHQVGDRYYDRGEIVEVTRAPQVVLGHGRAADGKPIEFHYTSETVRVVAKVAA